MSKEDRGLLGSLAATIYASAPDQHTPASAVDKAAELLAAVDAKIGGTAEPAHEAPEPAPSARKK